MGRTYVSRDIQDQDLMDINLLTANQQFLNDSLNNECGDVSSVISSLSDVSSVSKRSKWLGAKHGRNCCLHCSRARRNRTHTQRLDSDAAAAGAALTTGGELYISSGTLVGATTTTHVTRKTNKQPPAAQQLPSIQQSSTKSQAPQQNTQSSSTIQLSDISFNSPESILSEESMPDRLTANILFNVQRLANPVSARLTKKALLELKQKHPAAFQDICLYSEVCKTLGRSSYRMNARRFLQELFLDLNFDSFYAEPSDILLKKEKYMDFERDRNEVERLHELSGSSRATKGKTGASAALGAIGAGGIGAELSGGTTKVLTTQSIAGLGYMPTHKTVAHLSGKLQPLASVYETSCENLLQDGTTKAELNVKTKLKGDNNREDKMDARTKAKTHGNTSASVSVTSSLGREMRNELRITSDSDESDYEDTNRSTQWIAAPSVLTNDDVDEVDGIAIQRCSITPASSTTAAFSCNTTGTNTASSQPTISSSNCSSEQTTNSSNRSSICTISRQPTMASGFSDNNMEHISISSNSNINNNNNNANANVNTSCSSTNLNANISTSVSSGSVGTSTSTGISSCGVGVGVGVGGANNTGRAASILENQNKKYTRGRFYTLELDLSCTKNKFPITDRSRNSANWKTESAVAVAAAAAAAATTTAATTTTHIDGAILRRSSCTQGVDANGGPFTVDATKQTPNSLTTTNSGATSTATSSSNANFHYRLPIMRQSYTAGITPHMQYIHTEDGSTESTLGTTTTTTTTTTTISNNSNAPAGVAAIDPLLATHNVAACNQPTTTTTSSANTLTITKSLAASLAKPIGSLYCEKRLQALKMDTKATDT